MHKQEINITFWLDILDCIQYLNIFMYKKNAFCFYYSEQVFTNCLYFNRRLSRTNGNRIFLTKNIWTNGCCVFNDSRTSDLVIDFRNNLKHIRIFIFPNYNRVRWAALLSINYFLSLQYLFYFNYIFCGKYFKLFTWFELFIHKAFSYIL